MNYSFVNYLKQERIAFITYFSKFLLSKSPKYFLPNKRI